MAQSIRDVMTPNPKTLPTSATAHEAALVMRDEDVGAVIVVDSGTIRGIVTDRDIVVRLGADGADPGRVTLESMCTADVVTVTPDVSVDDATRIMKDRAIRRLPVVENGKPTGIVSLGDLAIEGDGEHALADISAAPPNN